MSANLGWRTRLTHWILWILAACLCCAAFTVLGFPSTIIVTATSHPYTAQDLARCAAKANLIVDFNQATGAVSLQAHSATPVAVPPNAAKALSIRWQADSRFMRRPAPDQPAVYEHVVYAAAAGTIVCQAKVWTSTLMARPSLNDLTAPTGYFQAGRHTQITHSQLVAFVPTLPFAGLGKLS